MAEHLKLGSNPSSQSLRHKEVCIFYIFLSIIHTHITQMHVLYRYERAITRKQSAYWLMIWVEMPPKKEEKMERNERMSSCKRIDLKRMSAQIADEVL